MSITTQFLRRPLTTGAMAASSRRLARAMTQHTGLETARLVVELGPGTGVFTREILRQLPADGRLVAIELNPVLAAGLFVTHRDERLTVVKGAAAELAPAFVYRATLTTTREDTAGSGSAGPRASRSSRG
ncbi:rRNA adenine N-6-methyltransferase family protein [Streptomyces sp. NPDC059629]|uniref:rRNA adenine N-6-methyltransferase family protein n=1 Tax=Streptomyces sp. NPDC059629 TaxID=3346889 RepID=UPI00367C56E1